MATNPWAVGTDSGGKLREELRLFLKARLAEPKYKSQMPYKQHLTILKEGDRQGAGVTIRVVSVKDEKPPRAYKARNGHQAMTDTHKIALYVKADRAAGGADSVSKVFGALRAMFATRYEMPERTALEAAGIQNCMEMPEGLVVDDGTHPENEGTSFTQQLNLRCNTDSYLD